MNYTQTILIVLMIALVASCKQDKPVVVDLSRTNFDFNNMHYASINTISYQTDFGQILQVRGTNFELDVLLSDNESKIFTIVDSINSSDIGKARCILKLNNDFKFSTSGTIEYDKNKKSGTFSVNIENLDIRNGLIKVDTVINHAIVDFTNISMTDIQGVPMNQGDINDWGVRANWDVIERLVFNLKPVNTPSSNIQIREYPNPLKRNCTFYTGMSLGSKVDLFLVNANFEIEQKFKGLSYISFGLQLNNTVKLENYYRLYYKIYSDTEQFYGSGDLNLKIEPWF